MERRTKQVIYFGLATAIMAFLIYLADLEKFLSSVTGADPLTLTLAVVSGVSVFSVFAFTWHRLLHMIELDTTFTESFQLFMSGQFMNSVTPLGQLGGEPVMAYVIHENQGASYEKAFSAVLSADIINTVPYFTFMLGGTAYLLLFSSVTATIAQTAAVTLLTALLGGALIYLIWFEAEKLETASVKLIDFLYSKTGWNRLSPLKESVRDLKKALNGIGDEPRTLGFTAVVAHLAFGFQVLSLFFVLSSIGEMIDPVSMYFIIAVSSLANFSPTPGGSGTFEAVMAGIITSLTGIGFAAALTVSILYRVATYWSGLVIGYFSMISLGTDLNPESRE